MTLAAALLRSLPDDDGLRLGGFAAALLDAPPPSPRERLKRMVAVLAGRRTWTTLCAERLAEGDVLAAFAVIVAARDAVAAVDGQVETEVGARWRTLVESTQARVTALRSELDKVPPEAAGAVERALDARDALAATTVAVRPPESDREIAEARAELARLRVLEQDVPAIVAAARRELTLARQRHKDAAVGALRTLLEELDASSDDARVHRALDSLPELVRGRVTHMLESIARGDLRDPLVQAMLAAYTSGAGRAPPVEQASTGVAGGGFPLSSASSARLGGAAPGGEELETVDALLAMTQTVRALEDDQRARMWLAAARATTNPMHRGVALGYGLSAEGRHTLRTNPRLARLYLRDALLCLTASRDAVDLDAVEPSVVALWTVAAMPRLATRGMSIEGALAAWTERPERFFTFLEAERAWEVFSDLWSREPAEVIAELHLEVASAHLAQTAPLLRTCVLSILGSPQLFRTASVAVLRRLGRLLAAQGVPADAAELLARVAEELANDRDEETASARRAFVRKQLDDLHVLLEPLSRQTVVSADELLTLLRTRVDEVFSDHSVGDQPRVRAELLVDAMFPQRRSAGLRLPLRVRNEKSAAIAQDLFLRVSFAPDARLENLASFSDGAPSHEIPVGALDAGESREVSVWLDLDERLLDHTREVKLVAQLKSGEHMLVRADLALALRPDPVVHPRSPYSAGKSAVGDQFFGREREVSSLLDTLLGDSERTPLVVGVRRIGKTSILHHIENHPDVRRRYAPVYVSLEDRPDSDTTVALLTYLCEKVWQCVPRDQQDRGNWSRKDFESDPYGAFESFFRQLDELTLRRRVLLILDEFDRLIELAHRTDDLQARAGVTPGPREAVQRQVFGAIRKVIMTSRAVRMIFAGLPAILSAGYQDRLFGLFDPVKVQAFRREEALRVVEASSPVMRFDPEAREEVLWATGHQPYLLQLICHHVFVRVLSGGRNVVTPRDVHDVIEEDILSNETYFIDYRQLLDDGNRPVLQAMATLLRELVGRRRFVSVEEIAAQLIRGGVETRVGDLERTLEQLAADERPLIHAATGGKRVYRITSGILGDYLLLGTRS